ncbi:MAG: hypothetical protein WAV73_06000 [Candidatus Moraniibacteriota bacterium]
MKQRQLKELLEEAAKSDCTGKRRVEIQFLLCEALVAGNGIDDRSAGMRMVLNQLYIDTIRNSPDSLPSLLPFFAIVCGDREKGRTVANVDWSII